METTRTFGDPKTFSVLYRQSLKEYNYTPNDKVAICHFSFEKLILGNPEEVCFLPTWHFQTKRVKNFITTNEGKLYRKEFDNLTDREIFELIVKSNQVGSEFDKVFSHLPQLDETVWQRHYLTIDETIDGFSTCFYERDNHLNFIIEKNWPRKPNSKRIFYYKKVRTEQFINTLTDTIEFLEKEYPFLTKGKLNDH